MNEDTYEGQIDNPLSLNLYTYVENNPLTYWDPSGHMGQQYICSSNDSTCNQQKEAARQQQIANAQANPYVQLFVDFGEAALDYPGEAATISTIKSLPQFVEEAKVLKSALRLFQIRNNILLKAGSLDNLETRIWYLEQEAKIPSKLDNKASLEKQAKQAFDLRNQIRTRARELMSDRELTESLNQTDPNRTWNEIVQRQIDKGLSGDDIWKAIIESSQKSRQSVNSSLGLD